MLLQVIITGYDANGRLTAVVPCQFYGRHKVKFLSYDLRWTTQPNILVRLNSQDLLADFNGSQLIVGSNTANVTNMDSSKFEFVADRLNGMLDLEITALDGSVPANLSYAIFNFDFDRINEDARGVR